MPNDWNTTLLCPVHSNEEVAVQQLWGISLLNVTYKIFTTILAKYIELYPEKSFGEY